MCCVWCALPLQHTGPEGTRCSYPCWWWPTGGSCSTWPVWATRSSRPSLALRPLRPRAPTKPWAGRHSRTGPAPEACLQLCSGLQSPTPQRVQVRVQNMHLWGPITIQGQNELERVPHTVFGRRMRNGSVTGQRLIVGRWRRHVWSSGRARRWKSHRFSDLCSCWPLVFSNGELVAKQFVEQFYFNLPSIDPSFTLRIESYGIKHTWSICAWRMIDE